MKKLPHITHILTTKRKNHIKQLKKERDNFVFFFIVFYENKHLKLMIKENKEQHKHVPIHV